MDLGALEEVDFYLVEVLAACCLAWKRGYTAGSFMLDPNLLTLLTWIGLDFFCF